MEKPLGIISEPLSATQFDQTLISQLRAARHLVVFTGAGVSQESGIPTFRDAMTGLWQHFDAEMLATPQAYAQDRELVWGWYEWRRTLVRRCQPNPAHRAIAAMSAQLPKLTLLTQNVDDLHERAGSADVVHLHGSLFQPRCTHCRRAYVLPPDAPTQPEGGQRLLPPRCSHCGGWIRPGVVWFGEALSGWTWAAAEEAVRNCDVLLSIGTSAVVYPAAGLPLEAARRGACVIQVNPTVTELDAVAQHNLRGKAGQVLAALVMAVWQISLPQD